jgi:hypothetical protein
VHYANERPAGVMATGGGGEGTKKNWRRQRWRKSIIWMAN